MPSSCHPYLPKNVLEALKADPVLWSKDSFIYKPEFEQFRLDSLTGPCKDRKTLDTEIDLAWLNLDHDADLPPQLQRGTPLLTMGRFSKGDSKTWLHCAAFYADVPLAYETIRMGVSINKPDKNGATALLLALVQIMAHQTIFLVVSNSLPGSLDFLPQSVWNRISLDCVVRYLKRFVHIATLLIEQHADVETGAHGFTPLSLAVQARRWDLVELLLRHGACCQPIQDLDKDASSTAKDHYKSILSKISPPNQRPPQKCPCWSGKSLSDCHDNGRSKPRPEHFLCSCGKRKTYENCCKKKGIKIKEQWDDHGRWIAPGEENTAYVSLLNMDTGNMDPAVKPLLDMAIQPDLYEIGFERFVGLYPQAPGEPFWYPVRILRPLAKGLGLEDRFYPGWWYTYEQTDFIPQPWVGVISRFDGQRRMAEWNDLVDRYISTQGNPQSSFDIEVNLKISPDGGPLYKRCENEGCDYIEPRDGGKMKHCSQCKLIFYCSERCQKMGWKNGHKDKCKSRKHSPQLLGSQRAMKQIINVLPGLAGLAAAQGDSHLPFGIAL